MNKDQFQNKYDEIFQNIKEEKMDWTFEDFLKKAENPQSEKNEASVIPLEAKKPSFPKWFWMAAGLMVLFGLGFLFNYNQKADVKDRSQLVQSEVLRQKTDFINENHEPQQQMAVNYSDSVSGAKKDSIFLDNTVAEKDVLDEILPKRGRLKKEAKPRYVNNPQYNAAKNDSTGYKDSYVIVNGKRIDNVEEAINVTKYSFQIFANNVSEKLGHPKVVNDDY